MNGGGAVRVGM